ncbi:hypothetical protein SSX86_027357 [Deinandra increscens subsp. villosa]|uniref:C2H2-type domain-containing protein n=1 Tax=Deinandra increscens subsp. villosa TaxID=3103831 RepID=A0AAP0CLC3_9ASTR
MQKHKCKLCLKSFANGRALESSRNPTVRQRTKRIPRPESSWFGDQQYFHEINRIKNRNRSSKTAGSAVSDSSPEEVVAYCLMMLSRDKWTDNNESESEAEAEAESESDREVITAKQTPTRNGYRCETCNRIFRSYQALGGHIASHKKIKLNHQFQFQQTLNASIDDKIHECHVCFKVFASGQALGGHKRSHVTSKQVVKQSIHLIDLNLPAPSDVDDEVSKIEVSDGEFGKSY